MKAFEPKSVLIEEQALDYELGAEIKERYEDKEVPVRMIESHNRVKWKEQMTPLELFEKAKETLVVGVKKTLRFKSCQPSADYRVVGNTSCPGRCEYCYLATNLGSAVYPRVYVNIDEILDAIKKHIKKSEKEITTFEASSSSDPIALEHITGVLGRMINFFSQRDDALLRVATKFDNIDSFLNIDHNEKTRFRYSINSAYVIREFENLTPSLTSRLQAAYKLKEAGYPVGFIIAPIMLHENWKQEYKRMIDKLATAFSDFQNSELSFELIMFRFSTRTKNIIQERYPETKLDFSKDQKKHKGFGKYVYDEETAEQLRTYLAELIKDRLPKAEIEYFV
ncbi:spore photoproduct lyase [Acetohalobium arabaticum]|uniref:Radical SAM domain protein n=1 Tax=Acetohalobium arabaticum (strain ATCC 49924 / DSM 5501 / Z-7288) TaxID=574087 RepID=D9QQL2_ACEAZ|nr:spore photoproduct lyase [Acetohalobium arabaticum]ADL12803.1 Radical SAM domain protein [Acetohalobium arabaticum DSM 5501]